MINFRKIAKEDRKEFDRIFRDVVQNYFPEYSQNIRLWFAANKYRNSMFDLRIKFGAFDANKLVGFAIGADYDGGVSFIYWLAVSKTYQHQGIGTKLLQTFEDYVKEHGYHNLQLNSDERNLDFYKSLGYEIIGLDKKSFYGIDNYILKKLLQEPKEENFFKMRIDQ